MKERAKKLSEEERVILAAQLRGLREEIAQQANLSKHTIDAYFAGRTYSIKVAKAIEQVKEKYQID